MFSVASGMVKEKEVLGGEVLDVAVGSMMLLKELSKEHCIQVYIYVVTAINMVDQDMDRCIGCFTAQVCS